MNQGILKCYHISVQLPLLDNTFIRLKNKFSVELPVPDGLIELLDSCGDADRKLQDKSEPEKPAEADSQQGKIGFLQELTPEEPSEQ